MLTYRELTEKKLSQLNQQHVGTVKGLETAMHSQGIEPGEAKRDGHHVQYPKASFKKSGKPARGITAVDDGKGKLTSSTGGKQIRDAVLASGRVNKTPGAKAARAKEAAENKAKKAKNRDPFTREHSEWWLDMWRIDEATESDVRAMGGTDSQIAALKKRQAKRGYGFQSNDKRNTSAPAKTQTNRPSGTLSSSNRQKEIRKGNSPVQKPISGTRPNSGGAIVKSKGSAMVRQKQSAPSKDAVGKRAPAEKGYMTAPDGVNTSRNSQKPGGPARPGRKARSGFVGGLQSGLGGDVIHPDKKRRESARRKAGGALAADIKKRLKNKTVVDVDDSGPSGDLEGSSEIIRGRRG